MIFFNERKLAEDLRAYVVTEKQQFYYLLIVDLFLSVWTTNAGAHLLYSGHDNLFDRLTDITQLVAVLIILFYSNFVNRKGDNRDFIMRYICLSVPISIKAMCLALILGILDGIILKASGHLADLKYPSEFILCLLVDIFLIWRYRVTFIIASGQSNGGGSILSIFGSDTGASAM